MAPAPNSKKTDPDGIRTRVAALKGPCPRPLDDGAAAGDRSPALGGAKQYADVTRAVNDPAEDWRADGSGVYDTSRRTRYLRSMD